MRLNLIIVLLIIYSAVAFSQAEYVPSDNRVYGFLERMETLRIIPDYNSFEIPKTRSEVAEYLKRVMLSESILDQADKEFLDDLKIEFEYELFGTLDESEGLIGGENYDFVWSTVSPIEKLLKSELGYSTNNINVYVLIVILVIMINTLIFLKWRVRIKKTKSNNYAT